MRADRHFVWLFGCGERDADGSRVIKLWKFCCAHPSLTAYLILRRSQMNAAFVKTLEPPLRKQIVVYGSYAHRRVEKRTDLAFVSTHAEDAFSDVNLPMMKSPLVVFPDQGDEPANEICGDYEDNALFRFVARDDACARYLEVAKGLLPYQIVKDDGLYAGDAQWERAAEHLIGSLLFAQTHRFVFVGFALTHVGGTPMATHALAEGLLEKGCQVSYVTLRKTIKVSTPTAIPILSIEGLLRHSFGLRRLWYAMLPKRLLKLELKFDPGTFEPACGRILRRVLRQTKCDYAISTRDSMHPFLARDVRLPPCQKIYFFHCSSLWWEKSFGKVTEIIKRLPISKAVFVTERNRRALADECGLTNCKDSLVLGNGLPSARMVGREQIRVPSASGCVKVCWPVRIEENRRTELDDCLSFGEFLRERGVEDIRIDVYGNGDYARRFFGSIASRGLQRIVAYSGNSTDIKATYAKYDAVVDFTKAQSFGMVYIEAVLNGKMVFCYRNEGSSEVLRGVPDVYFEDYQELVDKIHDLRKISLERLQENYDLIASRYSRTAIATRFLAFLNENKN